MFSKIKHFLGKESLNRYRHSFKANPDDCEMSDDQYPAKVEQLAAELAEAKNELARIQKLKVETLRQEDLQVILMLMARMAAAGEIAGGVAHEINNPLQVILGRVQIARMGKLTVKNLDVIETQAKRIAAIVRGFQILARGGEQSGKEMVDIKKIINDLIELVQGQFYKRNIQIETEIANDLPVIWGDVTHFQQLFLNFILSAKKRIEYNGTIRISVNTDSKRDLVLEIYDSGSILSKEIRRNISESFTGTTIQYVKDGCLTLAISAQMVRSIGGKVEVQSNSPAGNVVIITLPVPEQKDMVNGNNAKQHSTASMA